MIAVDILGVEQIGDHGSDVGDPGGLQRIDVPGWRGQETLDAKGAPLVFERDLRVRIYSLGSERGNNLQSPFPRKGLHHRSAVLQLGPIDEAVEEKGAASFDVGAQAFEAVAGDLGEAVEKGGEVGGVHGSGLLQPNATPETGARAAESAQNVGCPVGASPTTTVRGHSHDALLPGEALFFDLLDAICEPVKAGLDLGKTVLVAAHASHSTSECGLAQGGIS